MNDKEVSFKLKKIIFGLVAVCITFSAAPGRAAQQINVERYMNLVRNNNHTLLSALRGVEASYFQVLSSVSQHRPKVGISVSGAYNTATTTTPKNYNPVNYSVSPTLSQVIDITGVLRLDERRYVLGYEISRAGFDNTVNTLLALAEQAYWNVVLARENLSTQKDVLRQRRENLRVTEEKFNQQLVPKLDVIRATTQVSDAENKIVDAEGKLMNSLAALRNFAGGADVEPEDATFFVPALALDSDPSNAVALEKHPNIRQRKIQLAQAEVQKQISQKGLSPTLTGSAAWDMFSGVSTGSSFQRGEANVRLSLNIPLADGNFTKYDTINKAINIEAAKETLFASEAEVILNLALAMNNWNTARSLEENMKKQVERSNEELKITELMYNEGMGSQLDLITAQTDNQTVRTNYLQAVLGMYTAITDLRRALGDYSTNEDGSWRTAVVRYGKDMPQYATRDGKASPTPAKPYWGDQLFIKVENTTVNLYQAMDWLKTGKLPQGIAEVEVIDVPLVKKEPGERKYDTGYIPPEAKLKEITLQDAEEWLKKNR